MRFSNTLLASAVSALALAAPVAQQYRDDECSFEPETTSFAASSAISTSAVISSAVPTSAASSSAHSTSVARAVSASVASSYGVSSSVASSSAVFTSVASSSAVSTSAAVSSAVSSAAASSSTSASSSAAVTSVGATYSTSSAAITSVAASSTSAAASTTVASSASASSTSSGSFQWFGVNESGAEFGQTNLPGTLGTDYTWPNTSAIDVMMANGMNIFRIPILMERIVPTEMTGTIDATYLASLTEVVTHITSAGAHAAIDMHNFGRYNGAIFTSTSDFQTFWTTVAAEFKDNSNVIFDCNNEFHDEPSNALVVSLNQACIDGVRAAGATSQYIFVEGTSYTGAWTWTSSGNADSMGSLTDSEDKIIYEFHQYLDSDGSGTSATCVSSTIGAERIADATTWLQTNGKLGILGEYAGGANADCESAVTGMLDAMAEASDVWMGAMWWGAGPWWGDYIYAMEPPSGSAYESYKSLLTKYV